ncbi:MAG: hypothetical protein EPN86_01875 [Nanoarchaeota archaeon]|nr:MAG: hypothetical protein EPN86_01875 [Nanoarchaeota archaeon]
MSIQSAKTKLEEQLKKVNEIEFYRKGILIGVLVSIPAQLLVQPLQITILGIRDNATQINVAYGSNTADTTLGMYVFLILVALGIISIWSTKQLREVSKIPNESEYILGLRHKNTKENTKKIKKIVEDFIDLNDSDEKMNVTASKIGGSNDYKVSITDDDKFLMNLYVSADFLKIEHNISEKALELIEELENKSNVILKKSETPKKK